MAHANYLHLPNTLGSVVTTGNWKAAHFCHREIKSQEQLNHVVHKPWEEWRKVKLLPEDVFKEKPPEAFSPATVTSGKGREKQLSYPRYLPGIRKRNKRRMKEREPDISYTKAGTQRETVAWAARGNRRGGQANTDSFSNRSTYNKIGKEILTPYRLHNSKKKVH